MHTHTLQLTVITKNDTTAYLFNLYIKSSDYSTELSVTDIIFHLTVYTNSFISNTSFVSMSELGENLYGVKDMISSH